MYIQVHGNVWRRPLLFVIISFLIKKIEGEKGRGRGRGQGERERKRRGRRGDRESSNKDTIEQS